MEKEELKKYESLNNDNLSDTVGGHRHRHSGYYDAGHYVGKAVQAAAAVATIIGLCCVAKNNKE
ncbi:hypothetical protein [uncultured Lactobacillus sp.]|uniref:hypothetical protein n=1 Tax=uncultured Lactobacillus sp. TaxID=153152 RepID=UPI002637FCBC|nr:hypothetical protein [uncultured Lactobacillus sp.]